jgi:hypothetical protein
MDKDDVGLSEMLKAMHKDAVKRNATTISLKGHKCKDLGGYCNVITVYAPSDCPDCNRSDGELGDLAEEIFKK